MKWLLLLILILLVTGILWRLMRNRSSGSAFDGAAAPRLDSDNSPTASDSDTMLAGQPRSAAPEVPAVPAASAASAPPAQPMSSPAHAEPHDPGPPTGYDSADAVDNGRPSGGSHAAYATPASEPVAEPVATPAAETGPDGWTIKGDHDSMKYHTEDSPSYAHTVATAWFESEEQAHAAGFTRWDDGS